MRGGGARFLLLSFLWDTLKMSFIPINLVCILHNVDILAGCPSSTSRIIVARHNRRDASRRQTSQASKEGRIGQAAGRTRDGLKR